MKNNQSQRNFAPFGNSLKDNEMKSLSWTFRIGLFACAALTVAAADTGPANARANAATRAVLQYFQGLTAAPERHVVSGQFSNFGKGANLRSMTNVFEKTGHRPAIFGVDYADLGRGGLETARPNQAAIAYWKQGGLITVSAHLYNPANTNGGGLRDKGVDLSTLLAANDPTHTRWMQELDILAAGLQELRDAKVVVLWRPFHEMNGDWFWWGGKDPQAFIQLWRQMFDYFSVEKGLDNLIWVYSPNHGKNTASYYAGDHYVDLVGLDAYTDFVDLDHIKGYAAVAALPKPFGFTEYGPHGPQNPPGDYDYTRFLTGVERDFPKTCFFMCWNFRWGLGSNVKTKELLDNPIIINRENLPAFGN
jgi:mannan endo-1,4-beta-mannosidase